MPKAHRGGNTGLLRSHSRSSSTSKLGANLQFTTKDQKPLDKPKKNGISHDNTQAHNKGLARVSSPHRVHSREHVHPKQPQPQQQQQQQQRHAHYKAPGKPGFTIASSGDEDDDEGEWESSESGAATPNQTHSDSESESDDEEAIRRLTGAAPPSSQRTTNGSRALEPSALPRVETARPSDFRAASVANAQLRTEQQQLEGRSDVRTPSLPPIQTTTPPSHAQSTLNGTDKTRSPETSSPGVASPRGSTRRYASTRPPSSHSIRGDHAAPLRPHPLIRGHSYGQVMPAPLQPLTVISNTSTSSSMSNTLFDGNDELSTSPTTSIRTSTTSPGAGADDLPNSSSHRRQSVSSARSVATLPIHTGLRDSVNWSLHDRKRTLSTVSHSSSSAALTSLAHLPAVTRPPSPQTIAFFPPVNPHANIEGIHPLLPGPYLNNHLTVLARRTPIKEAFDRVIRAKQVRC